MTSISSRMITSVTEFRNPNGSEYQWAKMPVSQKNRANYLRVITAEVAYILIVPFAVVETALSVIAKLFSCCLPLGEERHAEMSKWVYGSGFAICWAACDAAINIFVNDLIMTEESARKTARKCNIFRVTGLTWANQ